MQTHRIPGLVLTDMEFNVPVDHTRPRGDQIVVFARAVVAPEKEHADLPWLVFFQGGPGYPAPRPNDQSGWLKRALRDYRVLLLDQRGTGRSTPITYQTLARFTRPEDQADYLKHFRADAIVRDAEHIRRELIGDVGRWSVLGQSYGGFCVTHYLSAFPSGLREAFITGGLPPLDRPVDDVYRATYRRVLDRNRRYYERYPEDVGRAAEVVRALTARPARLPSGGLLSPRRFQQLGGSFGMSDGFEPVHYLLEEAFAAGPRGPELGFPFLRRFENVFSFETNPIYAILHEPIYCQQSASNWSAERLRADYPEFKLTSGAPVFFTGEMIYPWFFEEYEYLRPLREAADILAEYSEWPRLYDVSALEANEVPAAAAIYYDDMYVERAFSEEAAQSIRGLKVWVTNEYQHNGIRADGERVLGRLLDMVHGNVV
jgi:pimeloyl-ACP methyl ester carboxylesterase